MYRGLIWLAFLDLRSAWLRSSMTATPGAQRSSSGPRQEIGGTNNPPATAVAAAACAACGLSSGKLPLCPTAPTAMTCGEQAGNSTACAEFPAAMMLRPCCFAAVMRCSISAEPRSQPKPRHRHLDAVLQAIVERRDQVAAMGIGACCDVEAATLAVTGLPRYSKHPSDVPCLNLLRMSGHL